MFSSVEEYKKRLSSLDTINDKEKIEDYFSKIMKMIDYILKNDNFFGEMAPLNGVFVENDVPLILKHFASKNYDSHAFSFVSYYFVYILNYAIFYYNQNDQRMVSWLSILLDPNSNIASLRHEQSYSSYIAHHIKADTIYKFINSLIRDQCFLILFDTLHLTIDYYPKEAKMIWFNQINMIIRDHYQRLKNNNNRENNRFLVSLSTTSSSLIESIPDCDATFLIDSVDFSVYLLSSQFIDLKVVGFNLILASLRSLKNNFQNEWTILVKSNRVLYRILSDQTSLAILDRVSIHLGVFFDPSSYDISVFTNLFDLFIHSHSSIQVPIMKVLREIIKMIHSDCIPELCTKIIQNTSANISIIIGELYESIYSKHMDSLTGLINCLIDNLSSENVKNFYDTFVVISNNPNTSFSIIIVCSLLNSIKINCIHEKLICLHAVMKTIKNMDVICSFDSFFDSIKPCSIDSRFKIVSEILYLLLSKTRTTVNSNKIGEIFGIVFQNGFLQNDMSDILPFISCNSSHDHYKAFSEFLCSIMINDVSIPHLSLLEIIIQHFDSQNMCSINCMKEMDYLFEIYMDHYNDEISLHAQNIYIRLLKLSKSNNIDDLCQVISKKFFVFDQDIPQKVQKLVKFIYSLLLKNSNGANMPISAHMLTYKLDDYLYRIINMKYIFALSDPLSVYKLLKKLKSSHLLNPQTFDLPQFFESISQLDNVYDVSYQLSILYRVMSENAEFFENHNNILTTNFLVPLFQSHYSNSFYMKEIVKIILILSLESLVPNTFDILCFLFGITIKNCLEKYTDKIIKFIESLVVFSQHDIVQFFDTNFELFLSLAKHHKTIVVRMLYTIFNGQRATPSFLGKVYHAISRENDIKEYLGILKLIDIHNDDTKSISEMICHSILINEKKYLNYESISFLLHYFVPSIVNETNEMQLVLILLNSIYEHDLDYFFVVYEMIIKLGGMKICHNLLDQIISDPFLYSNHLLGSSGSKKISYMAGIKNMGSTCYMNAVFQQLSSNSIFLRIMFSDINIENPVLKEIRMIFSSILLMKSPVISTQSLVLVLKYPFQALVNPREQQDAAEFFQFIMNMMPESIQNLYKCHFVTNIDGKGMSFHTETKNSSFLVSIPVKNMKSFDEAFKSLSLSEEFSGENQITIEDNQKIDAIKTDVYTTFGDCIAVQLNRFEYDIRSGRRVKINKPFAFPLKIDISRYHQASGVYELSGAVIHSGSYEGGHYTSYVKYGTNWYHFDDEIISLVTENDFLSSSLGREDSHNLDYGTSAYLLFYSKDRQNDIITRQGLSEIVPRNERDLLQVFNQNLFKSSILSSSLLGEKLLLTQDLGLMTRYFLNINLYIVQKEYCQSLICLIDSEKAFNQVFDVVLEHKSVINDSLQTKSEHNNLLLAIFIRHLLSDVNPEKAKVFLLSIIDLFKQISKFWIQIPAFASFFSYLFEGNNTVICLLNDISLFNTIEMVFRSLFDQKSTKFYEVCDLSTMFIFINSQNPAVLSNYLPFLNNIRKNPNNYSVFHQLKHFVQPDSNTTMMDFSEFENYALRIPDTKSLLTYLKKSMNHELYHNFVIYFLRRHIQKVWLRLLLSNKQMESLSLRMFPDVKALDSYSITDYGLDLKKLFPKKPDNTYVFDTETIKTQFNDFRNQAFICMQDYISNYSNYEINENVLSGAFRVIHWIILRCRVMNNNDVDILVSFVQRIYKSLKQDNDESRLESIRPFILLDQNQKEYLFEHYFSEMVSIYFVSNNCDLQINIGVLILFLKIIDCKGIMIKPDWMKLVFQNPVFNDIFSKAIGNQNYFQFVSPLLANLFSNHNSSSFMIYLLESTIFQSNNNFGFCFDFIQLIMNSPILRNSENLTSRFIDFVFHYTVKLDPPYPKYFASLFSGCGMLIKNRKNPSLILTIEIDDIMRILSLKHGSNYIKELFHFIKEVLISQSHDYLSYFIETMNSKFDDENFISSIWFINSIYYECLSNTHPTVIENNLFSRLFDLLGFLNENDPDFIHLSFDSITKCMNIIDFNTFQDQMGIFFVLLVDEDQIEIAQSFISFYINNISQDLYDQILENHQDNEKALSCLKRLRNQ